MNLPDQVLSIEQVQELTELGFDVKKYASVVLINEKIYIRDDIKCLTEQFTYSLTIGDIIDILPKEIKKDFIDEPIQYNLNIEFNEVSYSSVIDWKVFKDDKLINALFETLKWCINNKHI